MEILERSSAYTEVYMLAEEHTLRCVLVIAQFVYVVTHLCCCSLFYSEEKLSGNADLCF